MADDFNLRGSLFLNTSKFKNNLNESKKHLNSFSARAELMRRKIKKSFKTLSRNAESFGRDLKEAAKQASAAFAAISASSFVALDSAAAYKNLSDTLNITAERAQTLAGAFGGVEEVPDVFNTLADRAKDAMDGMQSFIDDFKLVGIEVDDLRGKSPDQLFDTFADAVARTEDPIARQSALVRILGDDLGRRLGPRLLEGAQGFRDLQGDMEATGVLMDGAIIAQAKEASDQYKILKNTIQLGLISSFAKMAPHIKKVVEFFQETIKEGKLFSEQIPNAMLAGGTTVAVLLNGIQMLEIGLKSIKVAGISAGAGLLTGFQAGIDIAVALGEAVVKSILFPIQGLLELAALVDEDMFQPILEAVKRIGSADPIQINDLFVDELDIIFTELEASYADLVATTKEPLPTEVWEQWKVEAERNLASIRKKLKDDPEIPHLGTMKINADIKADIDQFAKTVHSSLSGSISDAMEGDFDSIRQRWKSLLQNMVADSLAADLLGSLGLNPAGRTAEGKRAQTTGETFFSGLGGFIGSIFGGGGAVSAATAAATGTVINNTVNVSSPDAASFRPASGRINSELNRLA